MHIPYSLGMFCVGAYLEEDVSKGGEPDVDVVMFVRCCLSKLCSSVMRSRGGGGALP